MKKNSAPTSRSLGIGYMGSKNAIAYNIVEQLPEAETFVDLFAGGCAVTHAAILSGKYRRFILNDINQTPSVFAQALGGEFRKDKYFEWISRDDFSRRKAREPWIAPVWSFGNNGENYIYGRPLEPYKRALHMSIVNGEHAELKRLCPEVSAAVIEALDALPLRPTKPRRRACGHAFAEALNALRCPRDVIEANPIYRAVKPRRAELHAEREARGETGFQSLESLRRLERLQSLERLRRLSDRICVLRGDYRMVPLPKSCVVYCDPPYIGAGGYNGMGFYHDDFYQWLRELPADVSAFISEYVMPEEGFEEVAAWPKRCTLSSTNNSRHTVEKLFKVKH